MKRMKLSVKLISSFVAVACITLLLGIVGYYGTIKSDAAIKELGTNRLPSVQSLLIMSDAQDAIDSAENALLSRDIDLKARQEKYKAFDAALKKADDAWKVYDPLPQTDEEAVVSKKFVPAWDAWKKDHQTFVNLSQEYDKTMEAQLQANKTYGNMANQALVVNTEAFTKAEALLDQVVEIYRAKTDDAKATFTKVDMLTIHSLLTIKGAHTEIDSAENGLLDRSSNLADRKAGYDRIAADWKRIDTAWRIYEPLEQTPEEALLWKKFVPAWNEWKANHERFITLCKSYDATVETCAKADELYKKMTQQGLVTIAVTFDAAKGFLDKLVQINEDCGTQATTASISEAKFLRATSMIAMGVGVIGAIGLGLIITRSITKPILGVAETLSAGAQQTTSAASQVSSASQSLAEGSSEQAASLEETSSSLEELASMTKRNTDSAVKVNDLAKQARAAADTGVNDMQAMSSAMDAIKTSSDDIAKIIKTIDEIAFQTNILALNAAVEAARAGEAGMGFAVVADEVRALAQRSAQASKETAAKIEGAITKTGQGVQISAKVAQSLNEIATKARQVDELAAEVANASREQSQGIEQINIAVGQMDKVTQSNAAGAEESASAAEELNAQAECLKEAVGELLAMVHGDRTELGAKATTQRQVKPVVLKAAANIKSPAKQSAAKAAQHHQVDAGGNGHAAQPLAAPVRGGVAAGEGGFFKDS